MSDEIRDRLIESATKVFAERGYDGAGVHEIARRAGLTTGAIYSRFRGKDDLLLSAIEASVPQEIDQLLSGQVDSDATSIITQLGSRLIDETDFDDRPILLEAIVASRRQATLREQLDMRLDDDCRRLEKLVDEAKTAGLIDSRHSTEAITTFSNAVSFGMLVTKSLGRELPDHQQWDDLIATLVAALAPEPETDPPIRSNDTIGDLS